MGTPETIISSFAVVLDELQDPPWIHLFHVNDEYEEDENGDEDVAQPAGFKLPGGRYEIPRDESPRHTAQNETLLEIGLNVEPAKLFDNYNPPSYGEALLEDKTWTDRKGKTLYLKVYTFFMKRTDNTVLGTVEKNEGGAKGSFSLTDILLMPLARNTKTGEYNPYGIHFSARRRIFLALKRAGYNFLELIPNLPELIDRISWEEVGEDVYWILRYALDAPEQELESENLPEPEEEMKPALDYYNSAHEKTCSCDPCWQRWWDKGLVKTIEIESL